MPDPREWRRLKKTVRKHTGDIDDLYDDLGEHEIRIEGLEDRIDLLHAPPTRGPEPDPPLPSEVPADPAPLPEPDPGDGPEPPPDVEVEDGQTLPSDGKVVYVSPSGNDTNDGWAPANSKKTPLAGYTKLRSGHPDRLLFLGGAEFEGPLHGSWHKKGVSPDLPLIVSTYGPNEKAIFHTNGKGLVNFDGEVKHLRFENIHAHANHRDPADPTFNGNPGVEWGVDWVGKGRNVIFENCHFDYFSNGATIRANRLGDIDDVQFLRCVIWNSYLPKNVGWCQGIGLSNINGFVADRSVFYHNGWEPRVDRASRVGYNHDIYLSRCSNSYVMNSIFARESFNSVKIRSDSPNGSVNIKVADNLFMESLLPIKASSRNQVVADGITFRNIDVVGNVCLDTGGVTEPGTSRATKHATAFLLEQCGDSRVRNNLIVRKTVPINRAAISVPGNLPHEDIEVISNIVSGWNETPKVISAPRGTMSDNLVNESMDTYENGSFTLDDLGGVEAVVGRAVAGETDGGIEGMVCHKAFSRR